MSKYRTQYAVVVPQQRRAMLSTFDSATTGTHVAVCLVAGVAWVAGYASLGGGGTLSAFGAGGVACGLVLGVAFTRALGGPVLNLLLSMAWPASLAGLVAVAAGLPYDNVFDVAGGFAIVFPPFFVTLGCLLVWFTSLGPDRIDKWSRRSLPPAFLDESAVESSRG
ncbi:hypothetical protein [Haloarchaeobius sp. DFWS5]|uniref:hypothetical protein n=1 Tax=Haloarchaeobius sp. DFWS5 TaxID=3446114 RepID=UPI003EB7E03A